MSYNENSFELGATDGQIIRGVYRDTGEGAVGAFLHGLLSDAEGDKSMQLWHEAEKRNRSWIRFDMRAHGKSDGIFTEFMISRAVEDAKQVLGQFPNRPKVLVGSSMGGWVAAETALDPKLNVQALVLIAPAFNFTKQIYESLCANDQDKWEKDGFMTFGSSDIEDGFTLQYEAVADGHNFDHFSKPFRFDYPIRIIHGDLDDVVPPEQSLQFQRHVGPQAELIELPKADHRLTGHIDYIIKAVNEVWPGYS